MDSRYFQEIGPDEDFQTVVPERPKSKVIDVDCLKTGVVPSSGIFKVEQESPQIEEFLENVHSVTTRDEMFGLIWDKSLSPADNRYEKGDNYSSTGEATKQNSHSSVSFYRDGATGKKFAMKTVATNFFRKEEILIGLKNHPNICRVYGIILHDGFVHILQEHAGSPLSGARQWLAENRSRMLSFARQSFAALAAVHNHGYVHCDVKPDNIMISKDENGMDFTVKLIDFGSCQRIETPLSENCYTTKLYWSPEIWQAVDSKNEITCLPDLDVYALALTFYFVSTSDHLLQKFTDQDKRKLMTGTPDDLVVIALPDTIPSELRIIMKQCLAGKPRLTADLGVKQLNDETSKQQNAAHPSEENYRESLTKILYGSQKKEISNPLMPNATWNQTSDHNSIHYFVGSSKGIEKREREFKTSTKSRHASFSGSRLSKPLVKKVTNMKHASNAVSNTNISKASSVNLCSPPELDAKSYGCSVLLKKLALQAQPDKQKQDFLPPTSCSSDGKNSLQQAKTPGNEHENTTSTLDIKVKKTGQTARHNEPKIALRKPLRGMKFDSERQIKHKFKNNNEKGAGCKTGEAVDELACEISNREVTLPTARNSQIMTSYQKPELSQVSEGVNGDDMDFVFGVFDKEITSENDIVDNWTKMLDEMDVDNDMIQDQDHAEPMEVGNDPNVCASENKNINAAVPEVSPQVRGSRKRSAERFPDPSGIADKVAYSSQQHDANDQQLPDFDQILPEPH